MVVQDIFLTATAELADVVLPAAASWAESEGTVTNSERRVQRVRKALEPPGEARDDLWIIDELARRMGAGLGLADGRGRLERGPGAVAGPRRDVVRAARGARRAPVAVLRREPPGRAVPPQPALGGPGARATASRSSPVDHDPPVDKLDRRLPDPADDRPPARLVQHRRPDRRLHVAAAARRVARHLARGRRDATGWPMASASGSSRGAARSRPRSGSTSRSGPA